jgi:hypothetical protein
MMYRDTFKELSVEEISTAELSSGFYGNVRDSNHREEKGDIFAPK